MKRTIKFVVNGERCEIRVETRPVQAQLTIDLTPTTPDMLELSICGELPTGGGQNTGSVRELGESVDSSDLIRLCEIWDRWHLNGMRAGTRAQNDYIREAAKDTDRFNEALNKFHKDHYKTVKALLADVGMDPNPSNGYTYGTKWLAEPLPEGLLDELSGILDRLSGVRLGDPIDVTDAPEIDGQRVIDSRDVIKRLEIYRDAVEQLGLDPDTATVENADLDDDEEGQEIFEEFIALRELDSDCNYGDWEHGATLIREDAFEDHARELADDLHGDAVRDASWPFDHIDWEAAADALKADYTTVEFKGDTYYVRA